jgi:hypothetical protein
MTSNGHNNSNDHNGQSMGMIGDLDLDPGRGRSCLRRVENGSWCTKDDKHEGNCASEYPAQFQPTKPPAGWTLLLPPPRTWCRKCARPVPIVAEQGPLDARTNARTTYYRIGPHDNCADENTLASEHPQFRG